MDRPIDPDPRSLTDPGAWSEALRVALSGLALPGMLEAILDRLEGRA